MSFIIFIVSIYLFLGQGLAALNNTQWYDSYNEHTLRINSLYIVSLKLSKLAKDDRYKDPNIYNKIKENLNLTTKFCSDSFESEIYFKAQNENRTQSGYDYQFSQISKDLYNKRQEIYRKCKKIKSLLSRSSFQFGQDNEGRVANADLQNHLVVFENVKYTYKEIKNIRDKLKDDFIPEEAKKDLLKYYRNYKDYDCDWEYEKKLYISAKIFLKAKLAIDKEPNKGKAPASTNSKAEINSLLDQLERTHISIQRFCEEIQLEKDQINRKLN